MVRVGSHPLSTWHLYSITNIMDNIGLMLSGDGELSNSIYCQTEEDVPGRPESIKAIKLETMTLICWSPPEQSDRNGQIIHYNVYLSDEIGRTVPPNITKIEIASRFKSFTIYISASTKIGEGANGSISLSPDLAVGGLVSFGKTIHVLSKSDISLSCEIAVGRVFRSWFYQSNIIQGTERKYTEAHGSVLHLKNINQEDEGNYSCFQPGFLWEGINFRPDRISYLLIVLAPPPAPKLREHEVGFKSISIRWSIKESSTVFVQGFLVHYKVLDEWLEQKIPRRLSSFVLRHLSCGTSYPIFITAYNKAGISKPSQILNITTKGDRPSLAISPDQLTEVNNTWIRVNLKDAFNDAGCPMHGFRVLYRKKQDEVHWTSVEEHLSSGKRSTFLVGLEESTNYLVKILSENEAGTTEITVSVNTLGSLRFIAEPPRGIINYISQSLHFNFKLAGPIILTCVILVILISGVCLLFKKRSFSDHEEETPADSFTYFKQNCQNSESQQVYMTVKQSTPLKNTDFAIIPNSPDDVLPYATFELKNRIRNRGCQEQQSNAFYICKQEGRIYSKRVEDSRSSKSHNEDSGEEYENIESDSDFFPKPRKHCTYHDATANARYTNSYEPAAVKPKKFFQDSSMKQMKETPSRVKFRGFSIEDNQNPRSTIINAVQVGEDLCQIKV